MKPVEFEEQTSVLGPPQGITEEECGKLPVHMDIVQQVTISCWEPTEEEIQLLIKNKKLYVTLWQIPMCPIMVHVTNPFTKGEDLVPEQLPLNDIIDEGD